MEWYYAKHGKQEGPVDLATLQGMLNSGQVAPTDLVWHERMDEWTAAQEVPELNPQPVQPLAPTMVPPGGTQIPQAGIPQVGMQQPMHAPVAHQHIPNYLVPAILVTIFCCWPFGIPAIVFAAKVDGMVSRGDIAGALDSSNKAKTWAWVSFGSGLVFVALYIGLMVAGAGL
ncbi:MAG: CD225/dispanin family protein [Roseibacillus sp.]